MEPLSVFTRVLDAQVAPHKAKNDILTNIQSLAGIVKEKRTNAQKAEVVASQLDVVQKSFFRQFGDADKYELLRIYRRVYVLVDSPIQVVAVDAMLRTLGYKKTFSKVSWQLPVEDTPLRAFSPRQDESLKFRQKHNTPASLGMEVRVGNGTASVKAAIRSTFERLVTTHDPVLKGELTAEAVAVRVLQGHLAEIYEELFALPIDDTTSALFAYAHRLEHALDDLVRILDFAYMLTEPKGQLVLKLERFVKGFIQTKDAYSFFSAARIISEIGDDDTAKPVVDMYNALAKECMPKAVFFEPMAVSEKKRVIVLRITRALYGVPKKQDIELDLMLHVFKSDQIPVDEQFAEVANSYTSTLDRPSLDLAYVIYKALGEFCDPFAYAHAWQLYLLLKKTSPQLAVHLLPLLQAYKFVQLPPEFQEDVLPDPGATLETFQPYLLRLFAAYFYGEDRAVAKGTLSALFQNRAYDELREKIAPELVLMSNKYLAQNRTSSIAEYSHFISKVEKAYVHEPLVTTKAHHAVDHAVFDIVRQEQEKELRPITDHFGDVCTFDELDKWYSAHSMFLASSRQHLERSGASDAFTHKARVFTAMLQKKKE